MFTKLKISLLSVGVGSFLISCVAPQGASAESTPEEILQILRARDEQCQNSLLTYQVIGEMTIPPLSPDDAEILGITDGAYFSPQRFKVHNHEKLVRRNGTYALTREEDISLRQSDPPFRVPPYFRMTNDGGVYKSVDDNGYGRVGDRTVDIQPNPPDYGKGGPIARTCMQIEMVLGLIGRRIESVDEVTKSGERTLIRGAIDVWTNDESTYQLVLDENKLIRSVSITAKFVGWNEGDHYKVYEAKCQGLTTRGNLPFPETGNFKLTIYSKGPKPIRWTTSPIDSESESKLNSYKAKPYKAKVEKESTVKFDGIEYDLSEDRFQGLTDIAITPGTRVNDETKGVTYNVSFD